jgi:hypothetical protein
MPFYQAFCGKISGFRDISHEAVNELGYRKIRGVKAFDGGELHKIGGHHFFQTANFPQDIQHLVPEKTSRFRGAGRRHN